MPVQSKPLPVIISKHTEKAANSSISFIRKKSKKKQLFYESPETRDGKRSADTLSEDELKILAATRGESDRGELPHYDNSDLALAKRYAKKNKFTVLFVALTILLALAVIAI